MATGDIYACALGTDGSVACWSYNASPPPQGSFSSVSVADYDTGACGLGIDGVPSCWVGVASAPAGNFAQIDTGEGWACGVKTDETAVCWGKSAPMGSAAPAGSFVQVSAGDVHGCGLHPDGTVACWGSGEYGTRLPHPGRSVR